MTTPRSQESRRDPAAVPGGDRGPLQLGPAGRAVPGQGGLQGRQRPARQRRVRLHQAADWPGRAQEVPTAGRRQEEAHLLQGRVRGGVVKSEGSFIFRLIMA